MSHFRHSSGRPCALPGALFLSLLKKGGKFNCALASLINVRAIYADKSTKLNRDTAVETFLDLSELKSVHLNSTNKGIILVFSKSSIL